MKMKVLKVPWTMQTQLWWLLTIIVMLTLVVEVTSLSGPNVCMVKQKYNITKRVKYRAPMSVRTYEWCFAMPPRCSKWNTEMRDVTRLETEERTAEMAVCCPGYKLKDVSCVPICRNGKTGPGCLEDCPPNKWGPNCVHDCKICEHGICDSTTGECRCQDGWQGESCEASMPSTTMAMMEQILTTTKATSSTKTTTTHTHTPIASARSTTEATTTSTIAPTTSTILTTKETILTTRTSSSSTLTTTKQEVEPSTTPTTGSKSIVRDDIFNNVSLSTLASTTNTLKVVELSTKRSFISNSNYNRTEVSIPTETSKIIQAVKSTIPTHQIETEVTTPTVTNPSSTNIYQPITTTQKPFTTITKIKETIPITKKSSESTTKAPTTKLKPKEIWIRPAQKGESSIVDAKHKIGLEQNHMKSKTKELDEVTTPKTIIVSIIPTSVSYVTFRKLAFTTISSLAQKNVSKKSPNKSTELEYTKSVSVHTTSTPTTVQIGPRNTNWSLSINPVLLQNVTKTKSYTSTTRRTSKTTEPISKTTNSMLSTMNVANKRLNNSSILTTISSFSTNVSVSVQWQHSSPETSTNKSNTTVTAPFKHQTALTTGKTTTEHASVMRQYVTVLQRNVSAMQETNLVTVSPKTTKTLTRKQADTNNKRNLTIISNNKTNTVTDDPTIDEETFHILTEPEHITAVMGDKGTDRSTIDLISVISIAGGVMMAVITVAVVIVMLERCRRPRYEDVGKYNDIRMQVMIDKNDIPPPYVRSIFHTPLPDPPIEKCHYQPISTLDRNLKQFMRPVVVQTISPLMLENFRGILECHYDHLPRRPHDLETMETRCSMAPSVGDREELLRSRVHSITESEIEALKCEAKLDVIDNTTSEPLYAEIPCWRPPSARAIEVVNLNGEAVTEL